MTLYRSFARHEQDVEHSDMFLSTVQKKVNITVKSDMLKPHLK